MQRRRSSGIAGARLGSRREQCSDGLKIVIQGREMQGGVACMVALLHGLLRQHLMPSRRITHAHRMYQYRCDVWASYGDLGESDR